MWLRALGVVVFIAAQTLLLAAPAMAQARSSKKAEAAALGDQGMAAMQRGDYRAAAALFEAADQRMHSPMFLVFRARALEKQGKLLKADRVLAAILEKRARRRGGSSAFRRARKMAAGHRARLNTSIPRLDLKGASSPVQIDNRAAEALRRDAQGSFMLDPGEHMVVLQEGKKPRKFSVTLRAGDRKELDVSPSDPVLKATAGGEPSISVGWPIASFALAGVGLAVGSTFGLLYLKERDEYLRSCDPQPDGSLPCVAADDNAALQKEQELRALASGIEQKGMVATIGLATGGAALVAGTVLTIVRAKSRSEPELQAALRQRQWWPWVSISPWPGSPVVLGARGSF